jgi:2-iminobutanoate/2-iminopropanoate deaminase
MVKQIVNTKNAPKAIGPYSQAIKADKLVFISGQIPIDPINGSLVLGGIEKQTKRVMENIKSVIEASGCKMEHIVKTTIYLRNMDDFKFVNTVYEKYFSNNFPARSTVEVSNLPKNVDVEIDTIACLD